MKEKLLYENSLSSKEEIRDYILEGQAVIEFPGDCMRLTNALDREEGQKANYVLWCPVTFPESIRIEWEFRPVTDNGLCIMFFCADGKDGKDLFDPSLALRTGEYQQYHSGDMNAFHVSYFRRKEPEERRFHTCNLRKSWGFHLVAQGADPLPDAGDIDGFYQIRVEKNGDVVTFFINGLKIFTYEDDKKTYGPPLKGGKIGFRQLAPLTAEYKNLRVYELSR